jgi:hypothetical protein
LSPAARLGTSAAGGDFKLTADLGELLGVFGMNDPA